jgi:hypothetical protein
MASNESDRSNWTSSETAERRSRGRARRATLQGPATELMFDLAEIRTGCRVLELAAGTGGSNCHGGGASGADRLCISHGHFCQHAQGSG